ncbi:MAG: lysophospholipase [Candidatus Omnitrophota bacterium]
MPEAWTEHRFISFDETPIFYRRLKPVDARVVLILTHGMGEHGGRYRAFAEYLAGTGVESVIPDLRGFGKSGGKRACVRRFSDFHEDLAALHSLVASERKDLPLFLFGHSFGGLVTSSYLAYRSHPRADGLILSSPIFGIAAPVPAWRHVLGLATASVLPDLTQPTGVPTTDLTHDPAIIEAYDRDPLAYRRLSSRLYRELVRMIGCKKAIAGRLSLPTLVLQAGQDRVASREATLEFYYHLKAADKELEVYPDWYHEVLNEAGREKAFSRVALWISKHVHSK